MKSNIQEKTESLIIQLGNEDEYIALKAAEELTAIGDPVVPELIKALSVPNKSKRHYYAKKALIKIGKSATSVLITIMLNDEDLAIRASSAIMLAQIDSSKTDMAIPVLIQALKDGNSVIVNLAAEALGNIGESAKVAVPALVEDLDHADNWDCLQAIIALGKIGESAKDAVPKLIMILNSHKNIDFRKRTAEALRKMGTPEAIKAVDEWEKGK